MEDTNKMIEEIQARSRASKERNLAAIKQAHPEADLDTAFIDHDGFSTKVYPDNLHYYEKRLASNYIPKIQTELSIYIGLAERMKSRHELIEGTYFVYLVRDCGSDSVFWDEFSKRTGEHYTGKVEDGHGESTATSKGPTWLFTESVSTSRFARNDNDGLCQTKSS